MAPFSIKPKWTPRILINTALHETNIFDLLASALILKTIFILLPQAHNSKIIPWVFISFKQLKSQAGSTVSDPSCNLPNAIYFQFLPFFNFQAATWHDFTSFPGQPTPVVRVGNSTKAWHSQSSSILKGHFIMSPKSPASNLPLSYQVSLLFTFWEMSTFTQASHLSWGTGESHQSCSWCIPHFSHQTLSFSTSLLISNLSLFIGSFSLSYKYAQASSILKKKDPQNSLCIPHCILFSRNHFPLFSEWESSFLTSHSGFTPLPSDFHPCTSLRHFWQRARRKVWESVRLFWPLLYDLSGMLNLIEYAWGQMTRFHQFPYNADDYGLGLVIGVTCKSCLSVKIGLLYVTFWKAYYLGWAWDVILFTSLMFVYIT